MNEMVIGETIKTQISRNTLMCVGASNFIGLKKCEDYYGGLVFKIRVDNQCRHIRVELKYNDTYRVAQTLIRGGNIRTTFQADDVYCDQLDDVVYRLGSTRYAKAEWLAECGIKAVKG